MEIRKGSSGFGHLPCGGDGGGFPCMAAPSVAEERKSPGEEKEARGRRKERRKGADRWGRSIAREKGRGRATWVASWAACVAGRRGKEAAGPSEQAARCSCGQAAGTGQREEEGEKGRASWARRCLSLFFSNQMFIKFYFSPFSFLSQIQISFEYKIQIF